jgi:hypothetical protein
MSDAALVTVTHVIVDGGHTLPIKIGDLIDFRCPYTGTIRLGMILTCNQALLFYIVVYDVSEGRKYWIRSQNILRLRTI